MSLLSPYCKICGKIFDANSTCTECEDKIKLFAELSSYNMPILDSIFKLYEELIPRADLEEYCEKKSIYAYSLFCNNILDDFYQKICNNRDNLEFIIERAKEAIKEISNFAC